MSNKERELNTISFAGDTFEDKKLWGTYVHWALEKARFGQTKSKTTVPAGVDDPINRVDDPFSFALQIIVFSAFALEYRLKRVLIYMHVEFGSKETLYPLLCKFWTRLSDKDRLDKKGKCSPPSEWNNYFEDLKQLVKLRNNIAHANYSKTFSFFSGVENPLKTARKYYHSVVDAIRIINKGTGYETRPDEEAKKDFKPLRVDDC
ncbi:unnamed protein product [marine sediment metagenome]|uniref:RiboL-PSP-HEPN domain-containing protein n=1 Tax=marine sediment metagenome TaxID=412755 RepID=X1MLF7_9ZZZZ